MTKKQMQLKLEEISNDRNFYRLSHLKAIIKYELPKLDLTLNDLFRDMVIDGLIKVGIPERLKQIESNFVPEGKIKKLVFRGTSEQLQKIFHVFKIHNVIDKNYDTEILLQHFFIMLDDIFSQDLYTETNVPKIKCMNQTALIVSVKHLCEKELLLMGHKIYMNLIDHFCGNSGEIYNHSNNFAKLALAIESRNSEKLKKDLDELLK